MTMKCQEGKDIIDSHTRQGPNCYAAVQALKDRYDQPRAICRTAHKSFTDHTWKLNNEGIGKIITLIQRTVASLEECGVDSIEKLYTVIAELHMLDEFFRYWTKRTTDSNQPPNVNRLIETLQHYRLGLQGRTDDAPAKCRLSPQSKKSPVDLGHYMCRKVATVSSVMMAIILYICAVPSRVYLWRRETILLFD